MNKPTPTCQVCHTVIALYHCPRCSASTCSLACSKAHKITTTDNGATTIVCNGKRDRTKFCPLRGFDDAQLTSDYHFLEDVLKLSEGSKRLYDGLATGGVKRSKVNDTPLRSTTDELGSISQDTVPLHPLLNSRKDKSIIQVIANGVDEEQDVSTTGEEYKALTICSPPDWKSRQNNRPNANKVDYLVRQAELKGILLLRMPCGMSRRVSNTSKYNKKNDCITWKIELVFHAKSIVANNEHTTTNQMAKPTTYKVESTMIDTFTLAQELSKHLDVHPGNVVTRSTLKAFASIPRKSLLVFMKCLPCSSAAPKYHLLDSNASLVDCLRGKTVIEYPTIEVVVEDDRERFPLMISEI